MSGYQSEGVPPAMMDPTEFQSRLLAWYDKAARDLPWRRNPDPYRTWISEMMLQQTRVDTVIPYFARFLEAFPDVQRLADADEDRLLKVWQGLGYYSRARNLKKAAQRVVAEHGGRLPEEARQLQKLPGIGPYSAAAIASIAFGRQEVLMDGNVLRVMARICGIPEDIQLPDTQRRIRSILESLIPADRPGDFNQALMEIGAIRCLPAGKPLCPDCPFSDVCAASLGGLTDRIPLKSPRAKRDVQDYTMLLLETEGRFALQKRPGEGLLAGMWAFPMLEGRLGREDALTCLADRGFRVLTLEDMGQKNHIFTHLEWRLQGYHVQVDTLPEDSAYLWATPREIQEKYALPKAFAKYFAGVRPMNPETPV